ncbi:MAG: endonuclease/exonuclease/phosphatase family protein [Paludibacteraceae bacterium]|nr:endonuclease/exonuclease/phosphatase family protein [Paludibacteraceae bacterium]MBP5642565.1 endonuclease/exonuclease/phosphatase family protein [Paludibacteraceae bacterium]
MKKLSWILCIVVLLGAVWVTTLFVGWRRPTSKAYDHGLTIMTYNTHRMGMFAKPDKNRVLLYLQRQNADVVCLQEVEVYKEKKYLTLSELKESMSKYPYTYFDFSVYNKRRQFGNVVFSKYPLINKQTIRYASRSNISSRCDIVVGDDTLRLITNHLESNRVEHIDSTTVDKLGAARTIRHNQAKAIRGARRESPYPLLIVGDFNDIALSYTYLTIRGWMRDCYLESNLGGIGNTYERHHLGVRIDYILCSRCLHPTECHVEHVRHSDHYPIVATIKW